MTEVNAVTLLAAGGDRSSTMGHSYVAQNNTVFRTLSVPNVPNLWVSSTLFMFVLEQPSPGYLQLC